ncbi:MAG: hypothetical protein J6V00_04910 [Bacteroidaceae bacterium]|nr:hypothetical protein [Bacteroidaceae bacterium]
MKCIYRESDIYVGATKKIYYLSSGNNSLADRYISDNSKVFTDYLHGNGAGIYSINILSMPPMSNEELSLRSNPHTPKDEWTMPSQGSFSAIIDTELSDDDIPVAEILFEGIPDDECEELLHNRIYTVLNNIINIEKQYDNKAQSGNIHYRLPDVVTSPEERNFIAADLIAEGIGTPEEIAISDIRIDNNFEITLPLYPNVKIELAPLPKALYILLLRHPKGFPLKEINEYGNELIKIYCRISGRQNPSVIKRLFDSITNPALNTLHQNLSIIRHEFMHKLRSDIAQRYIPTQGRYQLHRIPLDSSKITLPAEFAYA